MAQSSFDVVSEIDAQEVRNALDQARREISTRFDFKNTGTEIHHDDASIEIRSSSEGRVQAAGEVIKEKMVRRSVSLKALQEGRIEPGLFCDLFEFAGACIAKESNSALNTAAGEKEIRAAIIIEIKEARARAGVVACGSTAGLGGRSG